MMSPLFGLLRAARPDPFPFEPHVCPAARNARLRKTLVRSPSAKRSDVDSMNQDCSTHGTNATLHPMFN
jgi:hypothetical protein